MANQSIEGILEGSPYSVPDDKNGIGLLEEIVPRAEQLEDRCAAVRAGLAEALGRQLSHGERALEVYESNRIEGKTASLSETYETMKARSLLDARQAIAQYTIQQALNDEPKIRDVVGLAAARILVDQYVQEADRPLSESDLRDMHALILRGEQGAGRYKQYHNEIEKAKHVPVAPVEVPQAMNALISWLRGSEANAVWRSAIAHAWLTHIHPFDDGNGRLARLMANYILGFGCYPPLIVKSSVDRPRYIAALAHSDEAGDIVPLVRLFVRALNRGIVAMEDPNFAWSLFQADLLVREDSLFIRWQRTLDRFASAVEAHLLTSRLDFRKLTNLAASDFELLQRGDKSGNAWYAKISRSGESRDLLVWIGYTSSSTRRALEKDQYFPSLFISERDPDPKAIKPYRPQVLGKEPLFDELTVIPDEERALLRRGDRVSRVKLVDAAELYAAVLREYLDEMSQSERLTGQTPQA